jgi:hypothetical protein
MYEWFRTHEALSLWIGAISAFMFVGGLLAVPWLAVRIPADYFRHRHPIFDPGEAVHPTLRGAIFVLKNLLGLVFLLLGVAMLVLPGQGILTILLGLMLLDFPGKFALECRLIKISAVHRAIGWMRKKAGKPPLNLPGDN